MRLLTITTLLAALTISPAHASFALMCDAPDGVSVSIPLGGGVGLTPMSATIEMSGRTWTTDAAYDDPQAIVTAQAFGEGGLMAFDFADTNAERIVASVRIFASSQNDVFGGILDVIDVGAAVVSCSIG